MAKPQFSLLSSRRFFPLFCTQFLGAFNDNVFKNALVILITYQAAEGTGIDPQVLVTLAAGVFILPFFLFSATAGQLADKFEKSMLIRYIKLAEIALMGMAAIGFQLSNIPLLMVVLFLMGVHSTFFGPLKYSILPQHLQNEELIGGNAMVGAATFLAILFGTLTGGLLILAEGGIAIVSALAICVAILGWLSSRFIPLAESHGKLTVSVNVAAETWRIIGHARAAQDVFLSIIGISWFWLVGATFLAQFPNFAKITLHANEEVVTFFLTLFSVGIGIGALLCNRLLKGEVSGTYAPYGALGMALFTFMLYFAGEAVSPAPEMVGFSGFIADASHWPIIAALLGIAVCGGVYVIPLYAIMQARTAETHRARIIAANNVLNALFMVGSALFTLALFSAGFAVTDVFLCVALINIPVAGLVRKLVKQQQQLRKEKADAQR